MGNNPGFYQTESRSLLLVFEEKSAEYSDANRGFDNFAAAHKTLLIMKTYEMLSSLYLHWVELYADNE